MESKCLHGCAHLKVPFLPIPQVKPGKNLRFITITTPFPQLHCRHRPPQPILPLSLAPRAANEGISHFEADPALINEDLKPTTPSQRTFTGWEMASLWVGLVVGVPTYYLAGSLVELGMAWWQGIATVVVANLILLFPLVLTGHPGTRYGIPFPVVARSAFGIRGAHFPTLLRALVACGWFGIETWIGGQSIFALLPESAKPASLSGNIPWLGTSVLEFGCFVAFWIAQMSVIWKGMDGVRDLEKYSAPILILCTLLLLCWAYSKAGGFGRMLSASSSLTAPEFWRLFFPSLTANISFWATVALNIPDFTRYAKTQADQVLGQVGLPIFMGAFTLVGLAVTSSTEVTFGHVITNPIQLLSRIGGTLPVILSIIGICLATFTTNLAANVVAPANAVVNLSPSRFSFRAGALLTAVLGILFQPWRLLQSSKSFIYTWLVGYSALLGPIGGIILVDYYVLRRTVLNVDALYSINPSGPYWYFEGYNPAALGALIAGILPMIPGFLHKVGLLKSISRELMIAYDNAWLISFFSAGLVYWCLSRLVRRIYE